jgi:histidinol phosphatase-like enzyme (inositol monophosphatase family)
MAFPSLSELAELRAFAVELAREAGELTLRYFRTGIDVETKADATPVTHADREAELLIRKRIADAFPDDGILGEEFESRAGSGRRTWVVDPIDGTKSFVAGVPLYAVLIGVVDGRYEGGEVESSRVLVGVAHVPPLGETIHAARGLGARWVDPGGSGSQRDASVSAHQSLRGARVTTSDFADLHRRRPDLARNVDAKAGLTRTWGDAYGYLLVATGRMEAMLDPIVSPWDIAPLPVIIEESGGRFTDLEGRAVLGSSAVASNGPLHGALIGEA